MAYYWHTLWLYVKWTIEANSKPVCFQSLFTVYLLDQKRVPKTGLSDFSHSQSYCFVALKSYRLGQSSGVHGFAQWLVVCSSFIFLSNAQSAANCPKRPVSHKFWSSSASFIGLYQVHPSLRKRLTKFTPLGQLRSSSRESPWCIHRLRLPQDIDSDTSGNHHYELNGSKQWFSRSFRWSKYINALYNTYNITSYIYTIPTIHDYTMNFHISFSTAAHINMRSSHRCSTRRHQCPWARQSDTWPCGPPPRTAPHGLFCCGNDMTCRIMSWKITVYAWNITYSYSNVHHLWIALVIPLLILSQLIPNLPWTGRR